MKNPLNSKLYFYEERLWPKQVLIDIQVNEVENFRLFEFDEGKRVSEISRNDT